MCLSSMNSPKGISLHDNYFAYHIPGSKTTFGTRTLSLDEPILHIIIFSISFIDSDSDPVNLKRT